MLLEMDGHETAIAHDGRRALSWRRASIREVILLDIGLPLMNGYEVARRVREKPWGRQVKLIAVTGWGQEQDRGAGNGGRLRPPPDQAAGSLPPCIVAGRLTEALTNSALACRLVHAGRSG